MSLDATINKASVLIEALPYLQSFRGHTFLIKMGGSAMEDPGLVRKVMRDIVFLEVAGINPVIVHGGGKAISAAMKEAGLEAKFIGGFRVTTPEAITIVEQTLSHTINPGLVKMITEFGGKAHGIPGTEVFTGRRIQATDDDGQQVDIGRVGEAVSCQLDAIEQIIKAETVPVISPLGAEEETGKPLNVNADLAAACLAKATQGHQARLSLRCPRHPLRSRGPEHADPLDQPLRGKRAHLRRHHLRRHASQDPVRPRLPRPRCWQSPLHRRPHPALPTARDLHPLRSGHRDCFLSRWRLFFVLGSWFPKPCRLYGGLFCACSKLQLKLRTSTATKWLHCAAVNTSCLAHSTFTIHYSTFYSPIRLSVLQPNQAVVPSPGLPAPENPAGGSKCQARPKG